MGAPMQAREQRIDAEMVSAFSDGVNIFRGLVSNISKTGIKVTNITIKFLPATQKYPTVVSTNEQKFKFMILPVWFNQTGRKLEIGFKIVSPPVGWISYIDKRIDENHS